LPEVVENYVEEMGRRDEDHQEHNDTVTVVSGTGIKVRYEWATVKRFTHTVWLTGHSPTIVLDDPPLEQDTPTVCATFEAGTRDQLDASIIPH
jgi:hypothetical protein